MALSSHEPKLSQLETSIIELLAEQPLTAYDIISMLEAPRSSVYQAIQVLQDLGKIRPTNPNRRRNSKYTLGSFDGPNSIIPSMRYEGKLYKAPFFLQVEEDAAMEPFKSLFVGLALILKSAEALQQGRTLEETDIVLRRAKARIIEAVQQFNNLEQLGQQILADERFWNALYLEKFPKDDAWRPDYHNSLLKKYTNQEE